MSVTHPPQVESQIQLLPPEAARDIAYYRERLADPSLLEAAVTVRVLDDARLAVPVGPGRLGGYLPYDVLVLAVEARELLTGLPGFPHLRLHWSPDGDVCHAVEWGEPQPDTDDDVRLGRFYGYRESAIGEYAARRRACAHRPPCPGAGAADQEAARVTCRDDVTGWARLCNGLVVFSDTGALAPDGTATPPRRPEPTAP
ncbi:DUF6302 family protein [Streptomyces sp. NPDC020875]|uniref:DUF6302 family protein n=1 Tax=Streptomyces sp. NPDC020875 TaxID=3154898 RepID=UPI00340D35DA